MQIFHPQTPEAWRILDRHALNSRMLEEALERYTLLERIDIRLIGISRRGVYYAPTHRWHPGTLMPPIPLGFIPWMLLHELLDDLVNARADALDDMPDHE